MNNFDFLLNYISLSSLCLTFRDIQKDLSQIFGISLCSPCCTRYAGMYEALLSLKPGLAEHTFPPAPGMCGASTLVGLTEQGGAVIFFPLLHCTMLKDTESCRYSGWKGPLRSPSPTPFHPTCPRPPVSHLHGPGNPMGMVPPALPVQPCLCPTAPSEIKLLQISNLKRLGMAPWWLQSTEKQHILSFPAAGKCMPQGCHAITQPAATGRMQLAHPVSQQPHQPCVALSRCRAPSP